MEALRRRARAHATQKALDHRDPPAADFERFWRRLMEQWNAMRSAGDDQAR
jgi:hypothetical protein